MMLVASGPYKVPPSNFMPRIIQRIRFYASISL